MKRIAILGTVGVPGEYGGFETLADNLVQYHARTNHPSALTVYCSARAYPQKAPRYLSADLRYLPLNANGAQAMFYDMWSLLDAVARKTDVVILLGHGGSFVIPFLRLISRTKFITNIDGIEWKREKWSPLARFIIRNSERLAIRYSHDVIADNDAIREYVRNDFAAPCHVIAYGGDNALATSPNDEAAAALPDRYALALCRIEPENNIAMILEAWAGLTAPDDLPLVFVGNWDKSEYGRTLRQKYAGYAQIHLLNPVYEPASLRAIRDRAALYVHGHSAGGTNPSLVEIMHFATPVLAHGCNFNRYTTEDRARYFLSAQELAEVVRALSPPDANDIGDAMKDIADRRYTWDVIGKAYFDLT